MKHKNTNLIVHQSSPITKKVILAARQQPKKYNLSLFSAFIRKYLENVSVMDIANIKTKDLLGMITQHWEDAQKFKSKKPSVKVYNPSLEANGWSADRTVVQIITDDIPFLVDSVSSELNRQNAEVEIVVHPVINLKRDKSGKIVKIFEPNDSVSNAKLESFMHFEITEQPLNALNQLKKNVERCINDVKCANDDTGLMRQKMTDLVDELKVAPARVSKKATQEVVSFLTFVEENNFTFLGFREYQINGSGRKAKVKLLAGSGLGVLRDPQKTVFEDYKNKNNFPPEAAEFLARPELLTVTKTNHRSSVDRAVHMDAIGIKKIDRKGRVVGHRLFVGLFHSAVYSRSPKDIPLLRKKIEHVFLKSGFQPNSHDGKSLENIFEAYPRDELFQVSEEGLFDTIMGIWHLQKRPRTALFVREDGFGRYVSCLVFLPRERYSTAFRRHCQEILSNAFGGIPAAFFSQLGDAPLARVHLIIKIPTRIIPKINLPSLERKIADIARIWRDKLSRALISSKGKIDGIQLVERYGDAFSAGYQAAYPISDVLVDIFEIEKVIGSDEIGLNLHQKSKSFNEVRFKIYHKNSGLSLSEVLPVFEHMGFKVINEAGPHQVRINGSRVESYIIHDFGLETRDGKPFEFEKTREHFHLAFRKIWSGDAESDGFNALIISAGLSWREVVILRSYCKYLRQTNIAFSQTYMEQTLFNNARMARMLVDMFLSLFNPGGKLYVSKARQIRARFIAALEKVLSADEDRILRLFLNLIDSTTRTNYFQTFETSHFKPYLSLKIDSQKVLELPLPKPYREIFVYSPRVEGIHLRFGKVARGGLRWSDRPEDFRTEILGLVKAQQVKNAVIVPVGSKGGFVVKRPPLNPSRDAQLNEGISCYQTFISGLLDLTDNLKGKRVVPPKNTVRLDGDDPYLVVAADKGTATFSDIANDVSKKYGHWLGDAFASGGSQGYDHKKMGITARGGWESVKRHFRELNLDTQTEPFTVVGVGDMSGDVFGNGMLLSKTIKLTAAFNHLHIFVDPNPIPKTSFLERKRLFKLSRSMWSDYDTKLLSSGGAIFDRKAKTLNISKEIQSLLDIEKKKITPNELIKYILKSKVDLIWFGGIGTYIKAGNESSIDVGDRSNDAIRIDGNRLRAKVVGEGANLGLTQLGRVEAAMAGVKLNTDAIDNSAGVDSSDHEVNIKILLDSFISKGDLSYKERNLLLAKMTDEVGQLVLRHNYDQTQAISIVQSRGVEALESQQRFMHFLEREDKLNREIEFLPDDEELKERLVNKQGLYSPEIAVLVNYAKNWLYAEILSSDLPDDPFLIDTLTGYFPTPLRAKYNKEIKHHRLNREIISTRLSNLIVNRGGETLVPDLIEKTGRSVCSISRAWFIAQEILDMHELWKEIEMLDNKIPAQCQINMMLETNKLLEWVALWFLRNDDEELNLKQNIVIYQKHLKVLSKNLTKVLPAHYMSDAENRGTHYITDGVSPHLVFKITHLINLYPACDIVRLAITRGYDVLNIAKIYYAIGSKFRLGGLRAAANNIIPKSHWQTRAISALVEELYSHQLRLTESVIDTAKDGKKGDAAIKYWVSKNHVRMEPTEQLLLDLWASEVDDLSMISVASRQIRSLAEGQNYCKPG